MENVGLQRNQISPLWGDILGISALNLVFVVCDRNLILSCSENYELFKTSKKNWIRQILRKLWSIEISRNVSNFLYKSWNQKTSKKVLFFYKFLLPTLNASFSELRKSYELRFGESQRTGRNFLKNENLTWIFNILVFL